MEPNKDPLSSILKKVRKPASLRELIAACLRNVHLGNEYTREDGVALPSTPQFLVDNVHSQTLVLRGIHCELYHPKELSNALRPLILYMHGGGFVLGSSQDTDYITRMLAFQNDALVLSVNYSLSPESIFPTALNDCIRALRGFIESEQMGLINAEQIMVAGDSAGANLALGVALSVDIPATICGTILFAPWLDMHLEEYDSFNRFAPSGIIFDSAFMGYARAAYTSYSEWTNPLVSPIYADIERFPPTLILIGTADPLLDQTLTLKGIAENSDNAQIKTVTYADVPHCFYSFAGLFAEETDCFNQIQIFISQLLNKQAGLNT